jgi:exodeoxyribonuclease X
MTVFHVIDIETTGLDPETHKVVEIAARAFAHDPGCLNHGWIEDLQDLVNPGVPIPPENSAIHHLLDEDVAEALPIEQVAPAYCPDSVDYFVAHNARFEKSFLTGELGFVQPWLCTYKIAAKLWPDAPSHSNQVLRYWLKLPVPRDIGVPHRALPDCIVTTEILRLALTMAPIEDMLRWSNEPVLKRTCTFGKHANALWSEVPKDYLRWIVNNGTFDEDVMHTARHYLKA